MADPTPTGAPSWGQLVAILNGIMGEVCVLAALDGGWFWLPAWWLRTMAWLVIAVGIALLVTGLVIKAVTPSPGSVEVEP